MRRVSSLALTLLILSMAAVAIATVAVPRVTGTSAITVDANSMQRVLPVGSLLFVAPQTDYAIGDYISYRQNGHLVTHELVEFLVDPATGQPSHLWMHTKGTENDFIDPIEVQQSDIVGKVVWHAPLIGLVPKVITQPTVAAFLLLLAGGLWWVSTSPRQQPLPADTTASQMVEG